MRKTWKRKPTGPQVLYRIDSSAVAFTRSLDELADYIDADVSNVIRLAVLKVHQGVIKRSPVDTGAYRASHGIASGAEPSDTEGLVSQETAGELSWSEGGSMAAEAWDWQLGDGTIWLYNNQPYAIPLEQGHSSQAPGGVYALVIPDLNAKIREAITEAKTLA